VSEEIESLLSRVFDAGDVIAALIGAGFAERLSKPSSAPPRRPPSGLLGEAAEEKTGFGGMVQRASQAYQIAQPH
jgi:hypothetical protein